jgi:predicted nucleic acid-binding protein
MFNILIDTSVWLDLAENFKQTPLLVPLVSLLSGGHARLIVPRIVLAEFKANRQRVAKTSERSLSSHFNAVQEAIDKTAGDENEKSMVLSYLMDTAHKIPLIGGEAKGTLDRIETILDTVEPIETSDFAKINAADRAVHRKAPCHTNKNSVADAILIETYFACVEGGNPDDQFAFVTHNYTDFSLAGGNRKLPHPDLQAGFDESRSFYFITLLDCLRAIDQELVRFLVSEHSVEFRPRNLTEIMEQMELLTQQSWHARHSQKQQEVEIGKHSIVSRAEWDASLDKDANYADGHTAEDTWERAQTAQKLAEAKLGEGNIGPYTQTQYKLGLIHGRLAALQWVLGGD